MNSIRMVAAFSRGGTTQAVLHPLALLLLQLHSKLDWRADLAGKLPFFFFDVCQVVFSQEQKLVEQAEIKKILDS